MNKTFCTFKKKLQTLENSTYSLQNYSFKPYRIVENIEDIDDVI